MVGPGAMSVFPELQVPYPVLLILVGPVAPVKSDCASNPGIAMISVALSGIAWAARTIRARVAKALITWTMPSTARPPRRLLP